MDHIKRIPLPDRRKSWEQKLKVGGQTIHIGFGEYEDGSLGEIFIDCHKQGTMIRGFLHCIAIFISIALQHKIPIQAFLDSINDIEFIPSGAVEYSHEVKKAVNIVDAVIQQAAALYPEPKTIELTALMTGWKCPDDKKWGS